MLQITNGAKQQFQKTINNNTFAKAWFPYDRNDRGRSDRCDHMETRLNQRWFLDYQEKPGQIDYII